MINAWRWIDRSYAHHAGRREWQLADGRGRERATIWQNAEDRFTWHTWDEQGTGGENCEASSLDDAKRHCIAAIVRQGWAPGGWKVRW